MTTFRCEALRKSFDGVKALSDFDLVLPSEGITAIIGPNGAGKTTLINVLTGFLRPDSGKVHFGEHEIARLAPHKIVTLGIARTFQDLRLILQVRAIDNVLLARPNQRGERLFFALTRMGVKKEEARNREEAKRVLRFVGLEGEADELAGELSYGQQKLLSLACCLATDAQVLILDEPIAGVHPEMASRILELLLQLRAEGKDVLFIEHDLGAVRRIAEHVIVMDHGKIIAQGTPREVLERADIMEAYLG